MSDINCIRMNCFYCVSGHCSSITATVAGPACTQFLAKSQARQRAVPRRIDMAMLRKHLEAAHGSEPQGTQERLTRSVA